MPYCLVTVQAERDSLAGLSEVLTSQTPNLISTGHSDWYGEPDQALQQQQPQNPGLTHLRKRLGLPLQQSLHQETVHQATDQAGLHRQGHQTPDSSNVLMQPRFATCSYEVSVTLWLL